jgi:exosortase H (IPTLxxWG-CTERM-specific)
VTAKPNYKNHIIRSSDLRRILIFAALLGAVAAAIAFLTSQDSAMRSLQVAIAVATSSMINIFGGQTSVTGNVIHSPGGFSISVVTACSGIFTTGVFIVAVLAFPVGILAKLVGVLVGVAGVFVINLVRLASLFYVGIHFSNLFEPMHLLVWQSLVIVFALFLWLLWAKKVTHAHDS